MGIIITDGLDLAIRYRKWIAGIPANFWLRNVKLVEQLVATWKLQPMNPAAFAPLPEVDVAPAAGKRAFTLIKRPPIPGGIRFPHMHLKDKIYMLNDKQWTDFSAKVRTDFAAKLEKAKTVSFDQMMYLSDAMDAIPGV